LSSGCTVSGVTVPQAGYTAGTPFSSGQQINVVIPANSVLPSSTELDIVECAAPGGVVPTDTSQCDGNTINPDSLQTNGDGSINYQGYTGSYYELYALPNAALGETPSGSPKCNLSNECVLYIGTNNLDFTQPHLWSTPFYINPNGGSNSGANPGDGTPEVPLAVMLPIAAMGLVGGTLFFRRRRVARA
jgi:hypothetical protein